MSGRQNPCRASLKVLVYPAGSSVWLSEMSEVETCSGQGYGQCSAWLDQAEL